MREGISPFIPGQNEDQSVAPFPNYMSREFHSTGSD